MSDWTKNIFGKRISWDSPRLSYMSLKKQDFKVGTKVILLSENRYIPRYTVKKDPNNPIWRTAEKGEILRIKSFSTKSESVKLESLPEEVQQCIVNSAYRNSDGTYRITREFARVQALDGSEYEIECENLRKAEKHEAFLAEMKIKIDFTEEE